MAKVSSRLQLLCLVLLILFSSLLSAQQVSSNNNSLTVTAPTNLTVPSSLPANTPNVNETDVRNGLLVPSLPSGKDAPRGEVRTDAGAIISLIILTILGLAYCFWGFSLFHPTLFITGFFLTANLVMVALNKSGAFAHSGFSPTALQLIIVGISLAAGFVGGVLLVCCWGVGVYVIGILGGYIAASLLIGAIPTPLSQVVKIVIIVVFSIIGVVLIHIFERPIIIGATSVAGAYVTVLGIDMVLNKGLAYDMRHQDEAPSADSRYEVIAALGLAFFGMLFQTFRNSGGVEFGGQRRTPATATPANKY